MPSSNPSASSQPVSQSTELANPGLLDAIYNSATDYAIITTNTKGNIATWNKGAEQVFGYTPQEIIGQPLALIFTEEDRAQLVPTQEFTNARDTGRSDDRRWHRRKDGTFFWADGVMTQIRNPDGTITGYLKILRDDTERKSTETKLVELARIDMLTGAANRAAFQERLVELSATALRNAELLILHLLDLDNFKRVNDRWGHQTGDKLLQMATQRMRGVTRDTDFIARLGGDEFVILQPHVHTPEAGGALAEKLVEVLSMPFQIDGNEIMTGASVGIVLFPQDATQPSELLRKADLALYKVKSERIDGYHYFSEQLDTDAHNKGRILAALKHAVKEHAFRLEYQPEIDVASGKTVAVEALLRCRDPLLANRPIEDIIALATETGLMPEIGLWVLAEACAQSRQWQDAGLPQIKMCINLCPRELLGPDLANQIIAILKRYNLAADELEVEITERDVFDSQGQGSLTVAYLRSHGVSIAIDDFGTGYSALSQLRHLPIDKLKLDQSFLRQIPADPNSCAIASAVIGLAHTLKLEISVEGVESAEQAAFFESEHCETLQGNFFCPPLNADDMADWLAQQPHAKEDSSSLANG